MAQLSQKRLFLLDMDGTIYLSDRLFDRVPEFLARVLLPAFKIRIMPGKP